MFILLQRLSCDSCHLNLSLPNLNKCGVLNLLDEVLWSQFAGSYIFIDAFDKNLGDKARLLSGWMEANQAVCLQFWYHMHGLGIGNLSIFMKTNQTETLVWWLSGDQGKRWRFGQTALNNPSLYKVRCKQ